MTRRRGSSVSRSIRTRSIAPGAARWPLRSARPRTRARRARSREEALAIPEHDLGVRADVDDEVDLVPRYGASDRITPAVSAPT
jgi:hypothetical protein